ncbi:SHOCT domain-containing protein [Paratractidigestivibacter sp.]|uniref:SHOCT domain-containing protein n=3 Tax=Paratractidigestivibacter sp. TaxID=2847316 RepID=UPI002ABDAB8A|nr:SHOCT domain-containing protein [Paratractidigestivibacter sp.]
MGEMTKSETPGPSMKSINPRIPPRLAAACLLIHATIAVFALGTLSLYFLSYSHTDVDFVVLRTLGILVIAISLLALSRTDTLVGLGALPAYVLLDVILGFNDYHVYGLTLQPGRYLELAALASLLVLGILQTKKRDVSHLAWALPIVFQLAYMGCCISETNEWIYLLDDTSCMAPALAMDLMLLAGISLVCVSMYVKALDKPTSAASAASSIGAADELLGYKKLLDNGTITQEVFDQKKKELLGL